MNLNSYNWYRAYRYILYILPIWLYVIPTIIDVMHHFIKNMICLVYLISRKVNTFLTRVELNTYNIKLLVKKLYGLLYDLNNIHD
jgi:hypothetical protein